MGAGARTDRIRATGLWDRHRKHPHARRTRATGTGFLCPPTARWMSIWIGTGGAGASGSAEGDIEGTQMQLYLVANTLGVSGDTMRMVERRAKQYKWIFWVGTVAFVVFDREFY